MLPIDAAAHASAWRRRHPVDKAVLGLGLTVLAVGLPAWPGAALVLVTALVVLLGPARVPARRLWRAYRVPLGFSVTGALPLLVRVGGGDGFAGWAPGGPAHAGELLLRTSAASLGVLLFAFTTPLSDLLPRLVRAGVPAPVVDVALVTYRMSFLLLDSVRRVRAAQAARLGHTTRAAAWRSLGGLGATAFVRAFDRAARLQTGLAGRGYDGTLRVLVPQAAVSARFTAGSVALLGLLAALAFALRGPLT
ncbi:MULTISPECIES: cobalt ECF transporter T component CbiQ [Streptomyces]|uniref:Cobalt/nickel transport system permease protein n=2 Tax=Streptomyces TaxID=1883 RepID=A0ABT9LM91_STRGD|nr:MULTISPECIES: cobalt ECF transporter T component CbiQ [Streptomyces]MDP9684644.1 cobalt/nickel transport system permease protein [Streptomyces griseoviridis]GGT21101.1 cobalt ECF transporter T component CbiQ [Streptomyces griseoviridis]GGU62021.1 cobalt ECF transporter T component CbiQ [Streptomyces daghestanicus]GHI30402.1 cobalt ECF transporter T component CbiQ [Streptomyces daghestanicus]